MLGRCAVLLFWLAMSSFGVAQGVGPAGPRPGMPIPSPEVQAARQAAMQAAMVRFATSGDGLSPATAYALPQMMMRYMLLSRLHLEYAGSQTVLQPDGTSVLLIHAREHNGTPYDVWFRLVPEPPGPPPAGPAALPSNPGLEQAAREVVKAGGDGKTPETAYAVGRKIGAEYYLMRDLGQDYSKGGGASIRGCEFDVFAVEGTVKRVFFKVGPDPTEAKGACVLQPQAPGGAQ